MTAGQLTSLPDFSEHPSQCPNRRDLRARSTGGQNAPVRVIGVAAPIAARRLGSGQSSRGQDSARIRPDARGAKPHLAGCRTSRNHGAPVAQARGVRGARRARDATRFQLSPAAPFRSAQQRTMPSPRDTQSRGRARWISTRSHSSRDHAVGPGRGGATDSHPDSASFLKRWVTQGLTPHRRSHRPVADRSWTIFLESVRLQSPDRPSEPLRPRPSGSPLQPKGSRHVPYWRRAARGRPRGHLEKPGG
jgi:hypothetical protein